MTEVVKQERHEILTKWQNEVMDKSRVFQLQKRLDFAEKNKEVPFYDFDDLEMITWFLHKRKHLKPENDRSVRTIKEYELELRLFVDNLLKHSHEIDLDIEYLIEGSLFKSLESRHLRRYQEWLSTYIYNLGSKIERMYSAATLSRKTTIIKSFFSFLYNEGYIKEPIHLGFRIASVRTEDRPNRDMGTEDVLSLLHAFKDDGHDIMFAIVHVLSTTGLRNEEFCKLQVSSVMVDRINGGHFIKVFGKGNKKREIPLKPKVYQSIQLFREARGLLPIDQSSPEEPLFTTNTGKPYTPSYFSQYVKKEIVQSSVQKHKELTITPHVFRHAFTIISSKSGASAYDIMRSLGHKKLETTEIYMAKVFEKERHAIHKWDSDKFGEFI